MANKYLYSCFDHWFKNGGAIYFYSDPHFNDDEMKYLRKNYISDEEQIARINSKIGRNDTLVILGDIGDIECVKKLRGYKVLIMGNHDAGASNYQRSTYNGDVGIICDNHLFDEVYEGTLQISPKLILSHEPVDYHYCFNIHGHDHNNWHKDDGMHFNMCAEHIDYYPVSLKSIVTSGALKNVPDIHRETIDTATNNARKKS